MKFAILTLGCKVNQSESDVIEGNLLEHGHSVVSLSEKPDYCVVNTCTVTSKSDYQSRQLTRRALRAGAKVIVTGCYAHLRPEDIKKIGEDVLIIDNRDKYNIINIIDNNIKINSLSYSNKSRPFIKVQDGCNNACSFCIVPSARGRSHSVISQKIVDQILRFEENGYNEIVLTGIHLGSYGHDHNPKQTLSDLIETILINTNINRIRLSSLGINEIDNRLLELIGDKRICKHLHIPLQSGDDAVLRIMRRHYDSSSYRQKISDIFLKNNNISIGTDVIVGFPGETETSFMNTRNLIEDIPFSYLHIFPYSSRPGSPSSKIDNQVQNLLKKQRYNIMQNLNIRKKIRYMSSQIGKILEIIMEDEGSGFGMTGTSSNYLKITINSNRYPKRSIVTVRVTGREGNTLRGIPVE